MFAPCRIVIPNVLKEDIVGKQEEKLDEVIKETGADMVHLAMPNNMSDSVVTIKPSSEVQLQKAVTALVEGVMDEQNNDQHLVMLVPQAARGTIVGKAGETISDLQKSCKVGLDLRKHCVEGTNDMPLRITGKGTDSRKEKVERVVKAAVAIQSMMKEMMDTKNLTEKDFEWVAKKGPGALSNVIIDPQQRLPTKVQLFVPDALIGQIVGKGGKKVAEIQKETGARVNIFREHKEPGLPSERLVEITGSYGEKMAAIDVVAKTIEDASTRDNDKDAIGQLKMCIPLDNVKFVIGKNGSNINEIRFLSSCNIDVGKEDEKAFVRVLTIKSRHLERRTKCCKIIMKHLEEIRMGEMGIKKTERSEKPVILVDKSNLSSAKKTKEPSKDNSSFEENVNIPKPVIKNNKPADLKSSMGDKNVTLKLYIARSFVGHCVASGIFDALSKETKSDFAIATAPNGFPATETILEIKGSIATNTIAAMKVMEELAKFGIN